MRTGIIAKKIGMSNLYTQSGTNIPVTVLHIDQCQIVERVDSTDTNADKVLVGACKLKKANKAQKGFFEKKKSEAFRYLREFSIDKDTELKSGDQLNASHFQEGQFIDVSGFTKGKGFAGVMKRHNFSGLRASHGVSISHRSAGSTGQCQDPGKVFKGKKMAGQYGDVHKTLQNLQVVKVDEEKNIICVKGATPGARGTWLVVEDSIKRNDIKEVEGTSVQAEKLTKKDK
ncbi:50S ribosomal protein L3 [Pelagibacteraceae bacterium]|nr:50S ribosomal protein L3 [Pelagibacteraceae bacterium]